MKNFSSLLAVTGFTALCLSTSLADTQPAALNTLKKPALAQKNSLLLAELAGKWFFIMTPPDREPLTGVLSVQRGGPAGYTGSITVNELQQELPTTITKAEVKGDSFVYSGEVQLNAETLLFEISGTIKGDKMEGQTTVKEPDGTTIYKMEANRK